MKTNLLIAVSALAIMAAAPAFAADTASDTDQPTTTVGQDVKQGWDNTKEAVSNATDKTVNATKNAYAKIKATIFNGDNGNVTGPVVTFDTRSTAKGIIGKPIYNSANKKIASVHDIILDSSGNAALVVVSNGGFLGIGTKEAVFDYSLVSQRMQDGDVIMPLSDETIKKAANFSYNRNDSGKTNTKVIPEGGMSVNTLLKAEVVNPKNQTVAYVDNITFQNGAASNLIVSFNKVLGVGGHEAAIPYNIVHPVTQNAKGDNIDFQLSADQAAQFESFKKTMTK